MRIIDGWHVLIQTSDHTWGFGAISILFILIGLICLLCCLNNKDKRIFSIFCIMLAISYMMMACHCKPITKTITEYLIECDETAQVNDFFNRFELQKVVDESHYIVRIKNWNN